MNRSHDISLKQIIFLLTVCITIFTIAYINVHWFDNRMVYRRQGNVYVCTHYLSKHCPLATEFARSLYPNTTIIQYKEQDTNKQDILIVVCGCSSAHLFNGVIVYGDNGHGKISLPGVSQRKVIYAGVRVATPQDIVLEHVEMFFSPLVAAVMSKNSTDLLQRQYQNFKRSFLIYHSYFCEHFGRKTFELFLQLARQQGFDVPVETGICFGYRHKYSGLYDTSLDTINKDIQLLSKFRFAVVIERENVTGYVSEKILQAFLAGTIPIYFGAKDVFKLFNRNAIIYFDPENPQKAIDKIIYLEKHKDAYLNVTNSPILADGNMTLSKYFSFKDDIGGGTLKHNILQAIQRGKHKFMLESSVNVNTLNYTKINTIFKAFESDTNAIPFYMYDNKEFYKGNWSSLPNCYRDKSTDSTDTVLLQMLKTHPWRTEVKSEAKVFIISLPLIESHRCDNKTHEKRVDKGMNTIVSDLFFKRYNGRDHLLMAKSWKMSVWAKGYGVLSDKWRDKISEVTSTRYEYYGMSKWEDTLSYENKQRLPKSLFGRHWEPTKRSIVTPYITPKELDIIATNYTEWKKRQNFIWYHTRTAPFYNGATELRHLPVHKQDLFPGDVGFSVSKSEWLSGWSKSKFCLAIRGDTPTTHAFYNALASSCIPVVISDTFDLVGLPFKNLMSLESIAITFPEKQFLHTPEKLVPFLRSLSEEYITTKLFNIKTIQPVLIIRHNKSIIPELILQETSNIIDNIFNMH